MNVRTKIVCWSRLPQHDATSVWKPLPSRKGSGVCQQHTKRQVSRISNTTKARLKGPGTQSVCCATFHVIGTSHFTLNLARVKQTRRVHDHAIVRFAGSWWSAGFRTQPSIPC